ncbi:MAG: amidohydrolase family protein, partial [Dehalococcoidia bacterium]
MNTLTLHNTTLIDGTGGKPRAGTSVEVIEGRITRTGNVPSANEAVNIDLSGCFLLPGLTDAHVHFALTEPNGAPTQPWVDWTARVMGFMSDTLDQGFTTVRDAGALDPAWARAIDKGLVRGPRLLTSGAFISQTGGHG